MKRIKVYILIFIVFPCNLFSQNVTTQIKLNQLGFYPNASKVAVVTGSISTNNFYITSTNLRDTLFKGQLSTERKSAYSNTVTKIADFSPLQKRGSFVVLIPGIGHSYVFEVDDHVHQNVAIASLKGFYYQRVSMSLEERYAGKWHRSAGHPDDIVFIHPSAASKARPAGTVISCPGGWYDAGDYNKYIVNSGISMGTLLSAYEDFPAYFKTLNTNIPESNDDVPDILNEVIYNLRWMLTMQDPNDGGVYHKCTNAVFDGMVMPGITKAPRYVVQKGTAAALDFAAVTAQASRIFKNFKRQFHGLADSCLKASIQAWQWAIKNPSVEYNQNELNKMYQPQITTGAYGDKKFTDEWVWAAAELFITTKNKNYFDTYTKNRSATVSLPSWGNVEMLGHYSLLRFKKQLPAYTQNDLQIVKDQIIELANEYISKVDSNAFQTVMGQSKRDFIWGSNAVAANQGILLINTYLISNDKKYLKYALTNLDYILGRNATGYCFVTGLGSNSTMHPHHRTSVADGVTEPVPGLLAGGPNPAQQDKCNYEFNEPETSYADIDCAYASNEIAINWNAPLVYLANAIENMKRFLGLK
jgi:Glycosyl hydrolase family 9./N-terminal ig-like domain of cellulase.